jgi:ligand-binding SRPBCC domain-containing protein
MHTFEKSIFINASPEAVFDFHLDTNNLLRITPPNVKVEIVEQSNDGHGLITLRVKQFNLFTTTWTVQITEKVKPHKIVDVQIRGPFAQWKQTRWIVAHESGSILTDRIEYVLPFGFLGTCVNTMFVRYQIQSMFAYRQLATKRLLEAH